MSEKQPRSIWNPQMAFGVVALGLLAAVWLNMAKLKMGMGQPEHDISHIPIARNVTSDQIEALRNGKPLELVLAEQPNYQPLIGQAPGQVPQPFRVRQPAAVPETQTTTAFPKREPDSPARPEGSEADMAPIQAPQVPVHQNERRESGDATVSDSQSSAPSPVATVGWSSELTSTQFPPQHVPRSNPATDAEGNSTGSSFVEKFPGQSARLPNLKAGPAMKEPTPAPVPESLPEQSEVQLPKASQLTPPPFGDFTLAEPSTVAPAEQLSQPQTDPAVKPIAFAAPAPPGTGVIAPTAAQPVLEPTESGYPTRITQEGDTWWSLAQLIYEDGNRFRELYAFNRDRVPGYDRIPPGTEIICPPLERLAASVNPNPDPEHRAGSQARTYLTQPSDTLFGIARNQLGQASRFGELLQLNRARLPKGTGHLSPLPQGTQLILPAK